MDSFNSPPTVGKEERYTKGRELVLNLRVINDSAERGMMMISDYNDTLTRNEEEKQALLQVVEHHRRKN